MSFEGSTLVDWTAFSKARAELGAGFVRILGYFREDGEKSIAKIEDAMHRRDATGLVIPAHTLKTEARQFGAAPDETHGGIEAAGTGRVVHGGVGRAGRVEPAERWRHGSGGGGHADVGHQGSGAVGVSRSRSW